MSETYYGRTIYAFAAQAGQRVAFYMGATGLAPSDIAVKIWKPGFSGFGNTDNGAVVELADGWYAFSPSATDTDTWGTNLLWFHDSSTGADDVVTMLVKDAVEVDPLPLRRPMEAEE